MSDKSKLTRRHFLQGCGGLLLLAGGGWAFSRSGMKDEAVQGSFYILTGVAGNVRYPNLWLDHALDRKVAPQPETDNYLTLEASEDALRVQCFLPDGTVIDDASITKV